MRDKEIETKYKSKQASGRNNLSNWIQLCLKPDAPQDFSVDGSQQVPFIFFCLNSFKLRGSPPFNHKDPIYNKLFI